MDNITNLKLPNCSICSLPFSLDGFMSNNTIRIPLLLHCAHAACENCIICNLRGKNFITCLVCKKVSSINTSCEDSDILSQFPIDNTLCGLCYNKANSISIQSDTHIGFIKPVNKKKDISKTTELCHECQDNRAEVLCNQCTAPYCQTCFKKVHLSARTLRDHTSTGLNESVNNSSCEDVRNIQCKEHETHNLEFYCEQCDETICSRCLLASHNGHQVKELLQKVNIYNYSLR
ncbi:hypothetical protein O3M35_008963 [Rhynocoris fuscipes]|uniref:Uncharacterized protein n=1 Tax=Rhynocoris fuscipes TaxID=488301 RepID=A0AAW1D881_9HEMI